MLMWNIDGMLYRIKKQIFAKQKINLPLVN